MSLLFDFHVVHFDNHSVKLGLLLPLKQLEALSNPLVNCIPQEMIQAEMAVQRSSVLGRSGVVNVLVTGSYIDDA